MKAPTKENLAAVRDGLAWAVLAGVVAPVVGGVIAILLLLIAFMGRVLMA